ncbi:MAG: tRNA lysidine(34) synthetase TilS C-terminal domain-containing protein, partial [Psychrobacter sp.]
SRPQAGKKLYQTLGVPVWLRDSLVVVSATFVGKDDIASGDMASMESKLATNERAVELPILLLSPFDSWVLGTDTLNRAIEEEQLTKLINSCLRPSNALYVI